MDSKIEVYSNNVVSSAFIKEDNHLSVIINTYDRHIAPDTTEFGDGYITWWFDEDWVKVYIDTDYFVFNLHDKDQIWFLLMPTKEFY